MSSIAEQKKILRNRLRSQIKQLSYEQKEHESAMIRARIASYIRERIPEGKTIASFAGMPSEPDLLDLHQALPQHRIVYPKCGQRHSMQFYLVGNTDKDFSTGKYGIKEPSAIAENKVQLEDIALFIVPAFGYTLTGKRLGKGGGYYDRALKSASDNTPFLGTVFSAQILANIPTESHDVSVGKVITGA